LLSSIYAWDLTGTGRSLRPASGRGQAEIGVDARRVVSMSLLSLLPIARQIG